MKNQETVPVICEMIANNDKKLVTMLKLYGMPDKTTLELKVNIEICRQQNDIVYYYNL